MSVADIQFKLGYVSLKSSSTFLSGRNLLQMHSAHPITAWPSRTGRRKGNIAISSFAYPYRCPVKFVIHLVSALFFSDHSHRELSA